MFTVLLVDDDALLRRSLHRDLSAAGYGVIEAENGDQAIASLAREPVDLVITDILMPGKDGLEIIRSIRQRWPKLKIVAMSGGGFVSDGRWLLDVSLRCGADHAIEKPFPFRELLALVNGLFVGEANPGATIACAAPTSSGL